MLLLSGIILFFIANILADISDSANIKIDTSSFLGDDKKTYQEVYYKIPYKNLSIKTVGDKSRVEFEINTNIIDDKGIEIEKRSSKHYADIDTSKSLYIDYRSAILQSAFSLSPGKYLMNIELIDLNSEYRENFKETIEVLSFANSNLNISDIQFAGLIDVSQNTQSPFYKNGLLVIPNPSRVYGASNMFVRFYAEIYNLQLAPANNDSGKTYFVKYTIYDNVGKIAGKYPKKKFTKCGTNCVLRDAISIGFLKDGVYKLEVKVIDNLNSQEAVRTGKFIITGLSTPLDISSAKQNDEAYTIIDIGNISEMIDQTQYIDYDGELKNINELSDDAKRKFLKNFWMKRDSNPQTPENEDMIEYYERVRYANEHFKEAKREGWKTDRGRIYIKFGEPSEIESNPPQMGSRANDIWYYHSGGNIKANMKFIFADLKGYGRYELIYSSEESETTRPDWEKLISPMK